MSLMSPALIDQLVDPADARLSAGSNQSVQWRCPVDDRHLWSAAPNTRKRSPGCPVCLNRIVIPGVNDLATTDPELAGEAVDLDAVTSVQAGSHAEVQWRCSTDASHIWSASVVSRTRLGSGCPYCSGRLPVPGVNDLATTNPDLCAELVDPDQGRNVGPGSGRSLEWRCSTDAAHTWKAPVRNRVGSPKKKPTGCPVCAGRTGRAYRRSPTLGQLSHTLLREAVDPEAVAKLSTGSGVLVAWACTSCRIPHQYTMSVRHRLRGQGCPVRAGTQIMAGVNDLTTTHPKLAAQLADASLAGSLTRGSVKMVDWVCEKGHSWRTPVYARVAGNGCPDCCPVGSSYGEQELLAAVRALDPQATHRARVETPSGRKHEVDVTAGTLALEFNGVFWHSESAGSTAERHHQKTSDLREAGLDPFTIWSDDWENLSRRAVLLRAVAHRLGALNGLREAFVAAGIEDAYDPRFTQRLGARSLTLREITGTQAAAFFDQHHVQGAVSLTRSFALIDAEGQPRAVLGLRSPSHSSRARRTDGRWEIQRYATLGIIPGGFSRLLAHAERTLRADGVDLREWVTLSTKESSVGQLYLATGFTAESDVPANYWYSGGKLRGRRAPKERYQLKTFRQNPALVFEEGWTEREAAQANGLYRVYDSGKTRWVKKVA